MGTVLGFRLEIQVGSGSDTGWVCLGLADVQDFVVAARSVRNAYLGDESQYSRNWMIAVGQRRGLIEDEGGWPT